MFYRYLISEINNEEILYLYLTNTYEFAKDLDGKNQKSEENIKKRVQNYINNRKINFNGDKVYLVVDGIIVGSLSLKDNGRYNEIINNMSSYESIKKEKIKDEDNYFINLELEDKSIKKISLRNYLLGTLASSILPTFHIEALKAQAIICRTYAYKMMMENKKVKAKNPNQIYHSINYYKLLWGKEYSNYIKRLEEAIDKTKGQFLTYNKMMINPIYHVVSNGRTENNEENKYLRSVSSIWDMDCPIYSNTISKTLEEVAKRLDLKTHEIKEIKIMDLTKTNRIKRVQVGPKEFTGTEIRNLLGLPSTDVSFIIEKDKIRFITRGIGNGFGLSQYGANGMAKAGFLYNQILYHYYPDTKLYQVVKNN